MQMLKIIDIRKRKNISFDPAAVRSDNASIEKSVAEIIRRVQKNGDDALKYYSRKFDGATISSIKVQPNEIAAILKSADSSFITILKESISKLINEKIKSYYPPTENSFSNN